jgi:hypothetical protein
MGFKNLKIKKLVFDLPLVERAKQRANVRSEFYVFKVVIPW